ncbi:MAG: DUF819 family protein [Myxococcaceae bacterium]|nr:DUF819 family protein [Myxococcaceae bacterium]
MIAIVQVVLCVAFPAVALWGAKKSALVEKIGPVVLCYGFGIVLGNLPGLSLDKAASMGVSSGAVPLAIPLLLFSTEVSAWRKLARSLLLCFVLACLAAVVAAGAVGWFFKANDEWWKIAGMLVGVYVGGTANMSAIGTALGVRESTFVLLNAADVVAGGSYLLFLVSVGQRLALKVLRPFQASEASAEAAAAAAVRAAVPHMAVSFALAVLIVGVTVGFSFALFSKIEPPFVMLGITTLGIAASLSAKVRAMRGSYEVGEYALLCFCVAVGSLADVRSLTGSSSLLLLFVFLVMVVAVVLHVAMSALFRLDADTTLITSTATIFGPPFIGPVAAALKNRQLVGPGLTMGLMGLALGTYLGLATAWLLRAVTS